MYRATRSLLPAVLAVGCAGAGTVATTPSGVAEGQRASQRVEYLEAFTRLYGYVRFFHPSDEASQLDWNRFAVHGVARVLDAETTDQLEQTLERLFQPVAPTVGIYSADEAAPSGGDRMIPAPPEDDLVAWQHVGVDLAWPGAPYRSYRLNRGGKRFVRRNRLTLSQTLDATSLRGRLVRLSASVQADVRAGWRDHAQLWLRAYRDDGDRVASVTMRERPITMPAWRRYEITSEIPAGAREITFGAFFEGEGRFRLDDVDLAARTERGEWESIAFPNAGFEMGDAPMGERGGDTTAIPHWSVSPDDAATDVALDSLSQHEGAFALSVTRTRDLLDEPPFDARPRPGESIDEPIGAGLRAHVPLTLTSTESTTPRGAARAAALDALRAQLDTIDAGRLSGDDPVVRCAAVVVAWSVAQHFYPYFDVVDVDWDGELTQALRRAMLDEDAAAFHDTLRRLAAALHDGHAQAVWMREPDEGRLPLALDWIERQVVVTASSDSMVRAGDVIVSIDGMAAVNELAGRARYVSGSPWTERLGALREFGSGAIGDSASLVIERGGEHHTVRVERQAGGAPSERRPESFSELREDIYYVDLTTTSMSDITARIDTLVAAPGVVFDVRGYPRGNHRILSHLLTAPDTADAWFLIPQIIYPDHERLVGYEQHGWGLEPAEPHVAGRVAFITDARAISYAEGLLSLVEHYGLGDIVGAPTAGANGNINVAHLPGLYLFAFGGMKVVKQDGSQFHNVGVLPTVPVQRTLHGVRAGRDELLEQALAVVGSAPDAGH